jgi:putative transposase
VDEESQRLKRLLDEQYLRTPFYGSRRMTAELRRQGEEVNRKRVQRLMQEMGLEALYPKKGTSEPGEGHRKYPYLLRGLVIDRPEQVWSTDITYIPMRRGNLYLTAVMDWYSRRVMSWELSTSLEVGFCVDALAEAFRKGKPEIVNTDQGSQYTSREFTDRVQQEGVKISMDGKGREGHWIMCL